MEPGQQYCSSDTNLCALATWSGIYIYNIQCVCAHRLVSWDGSLYMCVLSVCVCVCVCVCVFCVCRLGPGCMPAVRVPKEAN